MVHERNFKDPPISICQYRPHIDRGGGISVKRRQEIDNSDTI